MEIGDLAIDFKLTSDREEQLKLSDHRGKRVIVFFYPKADTPGCTTQACGFRDAWPQIEANGAAVIGISPDAPDKLAKWKAKLDLPYTLLSDPDHKVAEAYGVWGEKKLYGRAYMGIIRSHFIIGPDGRLEDIQVKVSPKKSIERGVKSVISRP